MVFADDVAACVVRGRERVPRAGRDQSVQGGRNAHRGTNLPQYDHRVKRWRWTEVLVSVGRTPVQNEVLDRFNTLPDLVLVKLV